MDTPYLVEIDSNELTEMTDKIVKYEAFLHALQMQADVILHAEGVRALIANASRWSYAHRQGNGELSESETEALVKAAFDRLCDVPDWKAAKSK